MDVVFDQDFLSGITGTKRPFAMAKPEHHIGKSSGRKGVISETTGDITNLTTLALSH